MHPLTNKWTFYIPDFLIVFTDKHGKKRAEIVEIKPAKEAMVDRAKSKKDKLVLAVNQAKWTAAVAWCHKNGLTFRVLTELDLFKQPGKAK
jgi:type III secretory pathway lipoprotein EscJ